MPRHLLQGGMQKAPANPLRLASSLAMAACSVVGLWSTSIAMTRSCGAAFLRFF